MLFFILPTAPAVETERFLKDVRPLLSDSERGGGRGHSRDRRCAEDPVGGGRRGQTGRCAIYYHHSGRLPVFLLAAYAKNAVMP